jgi:molecular chaperone DnaJ
MKDFYSILGIPESASDAEIKKAYRQLAKKYHPDINPGNKAAESKFKEVSEAHDILADRQKRTQYDQMRKYGAGGNFGGFGNSENRQGGRYSTEMNPEDLSSIFGEFGGFGSFADIFSSIFGEQAGFGGMAGSRSGRSNRGADLQSAIDVPFETAVNGGSINIRVNMAGPCDVCHGSGAKPGSKPRTCPQCQGRGTVTFSQGNFSVSRPCPQCLGKGRIIAEKCATCGGAGSVTQTREIAVKIPAGIDSGRTIRLRGLGNPGTRDGQPGDLYLQINISDHHFFWRDGFNIHCRIPITLAQAVSGAKIRVRTISGKKVDLKIPAGTISGAKFRLKGLGLAAKNKKGDQIVEVSLKIPEKMTPEEQKMYDDLHQKAGTTI